MIPRQIIDEIIFRNDIEQIIGSYVTLKRAGSNYHGLCPFHSEKTPSFTVFPATKSFYCFGCGAGGDVITFVMREENLDYVGALQHLASRAGITIEDDRDAQEKEGIPRKRIYEMNLAAARFFRECLFDPKYGEVGLTYLTKERGLSLATVKAFGLGFAPDHFWLLSDHLRKQGFSEEELIAGFLCKRSEKTGKLFDLFRNRVIFPVIDTVGNIVAFGGRVMDDSKPKYLNTSDTPAFKKSRHLFALNFARKHAEERMLLCEGYMDVIALHAAGFPNAVATLGTAITPDQARIFAKYTKQVVICYDSDNAGQNADNKAIRLLGEVGVDVRILKVNGAKDPDEYIKKFGADSFRRLLGETRGGFDYKMDKIIGRYDISGAEGKIKASAELCELISEVASEVERDIYMRRATSILGTTLDAMRADVNRIRRRKKAESKKKDSLDAKLSLGNVGDRVNIDAAKNIRANATEEALLGIMLMFEEFRHDVSTGKIPLVADDFVTGLGRRIFEAIVSLEETEGGFSKAMLGQFFSVEEMGRIEKIEQERRQLAKNDREVFDSLVDMLKKQKPKDDESDPFADLKRRQEQNKKAKDDKNT